MTNIILFLHFHKAGGTSVVDMFDNYNKHIPNANGNPRYNGDVIDFWNYKKKLFNIFKKYLINKKVNFIALEWNFFKFYNKINYDNLELITCIREPYERYISNLNFFFNTNQMELTDSKIFNKFCIIYNHSDNLRFKVNYNKYNYYVKMLNGFGDNWDIKVNRDHLEIAKNNLKKFNIIIILENKKSFKLLKKYGINEVKHSNKTKKKLINNLKLDEFKKKNLYDYELYDFAIKLSNKQLQNLI